MNWFFHLFLSVLTVITFASLAPVLTALWKANEQGYVPSQNWQDVFVRVSLFFLLVSAQVLLS